MCRITSLLILYTAPRWKEKYIVSWVELIFIVKHNNIHLLLPHLLHVDSIVKSAEVHRATLIPWFQKDPNDFIVPTFTFHLLTRISWIVRKIVRYFAFYVLKADLDVLANQNECDNRRLTGSSLNVYTKYNWLLLPIRTY